VVTVDFPTSHSPAQRSPPRLPRLRFNCRSLLPSMTVQAYTAGACACRGVLLSGAYDTEVESMMQIAGPWPRIPS